MSDLTRIVPLLVEVGDLKRVRAANLSGTYAAAAFHRSWSDLAGGADPLGLALRETATAAAAARLGAVDAAMLLHAGLTRDEARAALARSFDEVAGPLPNRWRERLREVLLAAEPEADLTGGTATRGRAAPRFVEALERQPRAGATRPGRGRLVLEPPESHADHCWAVAVYAGLLSGHFQADPATVFLAGLAHHLHNAVLPDSGHAGDQILADQIEAIQRRLRDEALAALPEEMRTAVVDALAAVVRRIDGPEARAFQAADVLDRVLQMNQYARVAAFTLKEALDEMDLVHPGPEQEFHLEVLAGAGLR